MKIFSVVGVRQSGKTTTVEVLIEELKKRGFTVGTVKTINCPMFSMEEKKSSNTYRHKRAGADVVCASAKGETAFIYAEGLGQNRIFEKLNTDYLILEGDYQADVPRIICAHTEQEVRERKNAHTFLVSGRIADGQNEVCAIPAISAVKDREALVQKVLASVPDTVLPVSLSPIPKEAKVFCQHACKKVCDRKGQSEGEGEKAAVERERKHLFLTGEKQIGKSTIWNRVLEETGLAYTGFRTCPFTINGEKKGYYMHAVGAVPEGCGNDIPIAVCSRERGAWPVTEAFDVFGAQVLRLCRETKEPELILMDELGRLERNAKEFQREVFRCLDSGKRVIGVLQKTDQSFLQQIRERKDVEVFTVTVESRENLTKYLKKELLK